MSGHDGKRVVITGGTSGFGLTTAQFLAENGARVAITGRHSDKLEDAARHLPDDAVVIQSDAASMADIEKLAERVQTEFGTIDALFVNAGVTSFAPFGAMTEDAYDEVFAVNTKGPYFTVQKLAPLLNRGSGVVLTTSISNVLGLPMVSGYAASKAALRSITRSLATELLPSGIRVNAISPGPIDTGILERSMPTDAAADTRQQMTEANPMNRFGDSLEVAKAVTFLLFDATYTTGAELPVDGGRSQL